MASARFPAADHRWVSGRLIGRRRSLLAESLESVAEWVHGDSEARPRGWSQASWNVIPTEVLIAQSCVSGRVALRTRQTEFGSRLESGQASHDAALCSSNHHSCCPGPGFNLGHSLCSAELIATPISHVAHMQPLQSILVVVLVANSQLCRKHLFQSGMLDSVSRLMTARASVQLVCYQRSTSRPPATARMGASP